MGKQLSTSYSWVFKKQQHIGFGESGGQSSREVLLDVDPSLSLWPLLPRNKKFNSSIISFCKKAFANLTKLTSVIHSQACIKRTSA